MTAERGTRNRVYLNDGAGGFGKIIEFGEADSETRAVDIGDMNGDGMPDIVTGGLGAGTRIYYGDENLTFNESVALSEDRMTASVAVADLNRDGRHDIVEGNSGQRNFVYFGEQDGGFRETGLREDLQEDTYSVTVGDLNGDGLADIVESNSGSWNLLYVARKE